LAAVQGLLKILPLAVVMVAGPQIISAILLATGKNARKTSFVYVAGAILAATLGTTICYFVTKALHSATSSGSGGSVSPLDYALVALLLVLVVRVFLKRNETNPPKWMGELQTAAPKFAFRLGFLLFFLMPTDVITMITVGGYLSAREIPLWNAILFLLVTALFIGSPLIVLLLMGKKAERLLPKMRDWMNSNSWIVSEVVIVFFLAMELNTILSG